MTEPSAQEGSAAGAPAVPPARRPQGRETHGAWQLLLGRFAAAGLALLLGWQAAVAANRGIAGLYADTAERAIEEANQVRGDAERRRELLTSNADFLRNAVDLDPRNADYRLQLALAIARNASAGIDQREPGAVFSDIRAELVAGLRDSPTRADLWSRLAANMYRFEGPTPTTLWVLDRATYFGPREADSLLTNARIAFGSWDAMTEAQRLKSWSLVVEAMGIPQLARPVRSSARASGWERQLQRLLDEQALVEAASGDAPEAGEENR